MLKVKKALIFIVLILFIGVLLCGCGKENTVDNINDTTEIYLVSDKHLGDGMASNLLAVKNDTNVFDIESVEVDLFFGNTDNGYFKMKYGYVEGDAMTLKLYVTNYITITRTYDFLINENFVPYKEFTDYFDSETGKINDKYDDNYYNIYCDQTPIGDKIAVSPDLFCDDFGKIYFTITEYLYKGEDFLSYGENNSIALYYTKDGNKITLYTEPFDEKRFSYANTINTCEAFGYNVKEYNLVELESLKATIIENYNQKKSNILYDSFPDISADDFSLSKVLYISNDEQTEFAYVFGLSDKISALVCKTGMEIYKPSLIYIGAGSEDNFIGVAGASGDIETLIWGSYI